MNKLLILFVFIALVTVLSYINEEKSDIFHVNRETVSGQKLEPYDQYFEKNLEEILIPYNSNLSYWTSKNLSFLKQRPLKTYSYTRTNFDLYLKDISEKLIECILHTINKYNQSRYVFTDIDSIKEIQYDGGKKIEVGFFIHHKARHSTHQLVLEYAETNKKEIKILSLESKHIFINHKSNIENTEIANTIPVDNSEFVKEYESDYANNLKKQLNINKKNLSCLKDTKDHAHHITVDWENKIYPYWYENEHKLPPWVIDRGPLKNDIELLQKTCYSQEPCKYELSKWNQYGIHQQIKLDKSCNISNYSDKILDPYPYFNPTLFAPI